MEPNKLRYYLSGITMIVVALICLLSFTDNYQAHNGAKGMLIFDAITIVVLLPLGIYMIIKARRY